ncbi:MlaC/ttg2D family ABC transporter substrate-binding protein [Thalassotalea atypica]|uniref:MlaC/ttg2D family ABC transporter substrate-binding protein n=1 Tax=Thalassotalea atypica TaxID=2054316 RepID=UPI002572B234|nr:ABC transporter substrate-binding protein [Thalassotalea atypica]
MRTIVSLASAAIIAVSLFVSSVAAEEISPYKVLETTGTNLFGRISNSQKEIEKFPEVMRNIVEDELMPAIDYKYAAYRVLGKNLKKITKEQRKKFVESMRYYLIRTYAKALTQYSDQQVVFEPEKPTGKKRIVAISTQIIDSSRPPIEMVFKMRKNKKTLQWKAFDMVVEGISLLDAKQAELSKRIAKHGVDQVSLELASIAK